MKKIIIVNKKISIILAIAIIMGQLPASVLALPNSNINKVQVSYNDSNKEKNLEESNVESSTDIEKEKKLEGDKNLEENKDENIKIEKDNKDSEKSLEERRKY